MKLIVGLGNPGNEYTNTRHNIGFMMIDYFLSNNDFGLVNWKNKFNGLYSDFVINDEKVIFLKPQSYMNLSGGVVKKYLDFFKIDISDLFVISDDLDLNVGNYKLKDKGSSGGHNGLKDIEHNISSQQYKRLKIGISNDKKYDTKDYVLSKFSSEDINIYNNLFKELNLVLKDYLSMDFSSLMNKYNRKNR